MMMTDLSQIDGALVGGKENNLTSLREIEAFLEQSVQKTGREMLAAWIETHEAPVPEPTTRCRECGHEANYVFKRSALARTHLGLVRYRRAYYVCPRCHQSTCPLDERLNPYKSLARMRAKIAAGKTLPVDEMAKSWGLGRLNGRGT